jgi:LL-diaminopimelate aminotransferase
MAKINENYDKLVAGYLFPEVTRRKKLFLEKNFQFKEKDIISLGIGDTKLPLTPTILKGLHYGVTKLGAAETYKGYGEEQGNDNLREAIAKRYEKLNAVVNPLEVFVSDGAKPDSANIQSIFSLDSIVAVQDPAYPVYVDTNVVAGRTGKFKDLPNRGNRLGVYEGLVYMPCTEENGFIPSPPNQKVDLIYLCSPNNPTGAVMNHPQLEKFVDFARQNDSAIIFDAAYSAYIRDETLPKSIFEIRDARKYAIEINSFSKDAGFTGVRLGWTVVPRELMSGKANALWNRRQTTFFNGASNIVQEGGLAALSEEGQKECKGLVDYYMENSRIIDEGVREIGLKTFWSKNAPYIFMRTPGDLSSWEFFNNLLKKCQVICTPGAGFGPSGEGYVRLSPYNLRNNVEEAMERIKKKADSIMTLD